ELVRGERFAGLGRRIVDELVALALGHAVGGVGWLALGRARLVPGLASVVGSLDDLPEPPTGLRRINPVRIDRRALEVVHLPPGEERPVDLPLLALTVGGEDKGALTGADENSNAGHLDLLYQFIAFRIGNLFRRDRSTRRANQFMKPP